ncbi:MAG: TonB family protein [Succinivibrio sp.]
MNVAQSAAADVYSLTLLSVAGEKGSQSIPDRSETDQNTSQSNIEPETKKTQNYQKAEADFQKKSYKKKEKSETVKDQIAHRKSETVKDTKKVSKNRNSDRASEQAVKSLADSTDMAASARGPSAEKSVDPDYEKEKAVSMLLAFLKSKKKYPKSARRHGIEGECVLRVHINGAGIVDKSSLEKESSYSVLNSECLRLSSVVIGFKSIARTPVSVIVPVRFVLND